MVRRLGFSLTEDGDYIDILDDDNGDYVDYDDYADLEAREARLREALWECVDSLCEYIDADTPGKMSDRKGRGQKAVAHAYEVLGDD